MFLYMKLVILASVIVTVGNFHPFYEVINCKNEELELLPSYREWHYYVDPPSGKRSRRGYWCHWLPWLHLDIREALALVAFFDKVVCVLL